MQSSTKNSTDGKPMFTHHEMVTAAIMVSAFLLLMSSPYIILVKQIRIDSQEVG